MPDDAGRDAAFYDHENESRRRVADWGGDELFTRMPRRRALHTGPPPRFRRPAPVDPAHRAAPDAPGRFARADRDDPIVDWTGPLVAPDRDEDARRARPAGPDRMNDAPGRTGDARYRGDDAPDRTGDAPYRTGRFGGGARGPDARPGVQRDPDGEARVGAASPDRLDTVPPHATRRAFAPAHDAAQEPTRRLAPPLDDAVPPGAGDLDLDFAASSRPTAGSARRTVVIEGRPDGVPRLLPERRRPPRTVAERVGPRPERIVAWAFALGLLLILIAIATADAATI